MQVQDDSFMVYADPTSDEIDEVFGDLRPLDDAELAQWGMAPEDACRAFKSCDHKWVVFTDGEPVFVFGLRQLSPGRYALAGFGSNGFDKRTGLKLTRWGIKYFFDHCFRTLEIRRIEAYVPILSEHSHQWLRWGGMRLEAFMTDFIRPGDQFALLAFTIRDFEFQRHVHVFQSLPAPAPASDPEQDFGGNTSGDGTAAATVGA